VADFVRGCDQAKNWFFDRPRVLAMVAARKQRAMGRAGAFVRQRAKTSIRTRKKPSAPGRPPSSHTGILKRFIFFSYDAARQSVVVGPTKTNQVFFDAAFRPVTGTGPGALEFGGAVTLLEWFFAGRWQRADLRSRRRLASRPTRSRTVRMAARPYMRPAMLAELPKFAGLFRTPAGAAA
jgi:hypothetical protein